MATKSKMSTTTTRKVTKTTTPPPTTPPKQTREQYEQQWADYQKLYKENKDYGSKMSEYQKKMKKYKELSPIGGDYPNKSGTRPMTNEEIKRYNAFWSKRNPESHMNYAKGTRIEKGVSIDEKGDYIGRFGTDPYTGKQLSWTKSGLPTTIFTQPYYEKPIAPGKPAPLGRQPYNPEYEPKLALKKPGSVKSSSEPAKIIKPKLTTEVPVAVEKPTKKKVPKAKVSFVVNRKAPKAFNSVAAMKLNKALTGRTLKKGRITFKGSGFIPASQEAKAAEKAVRAENKSTRAARRTFGKEEKLAAGYLKNQGIFEGDTKKEMKAGIKSYAKSKKAETGKLDKTTKQAIKTGKTAAKYVGKQEKGKIRSFTPEALDKRKIVAAKVKTTTTGKGKSKVTTSTIVPTKKSTRMQAGRYVY